MKKVLPYILTLVVLAGILGPLVSVPHTFAQTLETLDTTRPVDYDPVSGNTPATTGNSQGANSVTPASTATPPPKFVGCFSPFTPPFININACVANIVYLIMWIFSWILYISGIILDMSLYYTLHMTDLLTHVPVVDIGWKIFRDMANIFFIFILLWTAISTILGLASGKTKEILVNLIIVALLMNFSLFITKTVVDASNILALHFYNLIVSPADTVTANSTQNGLARLTPNSSFSGAFMEGLKIQTLYSSETTGGQTLDAAGNISSVIATTNAVTGGVINFSKIILIGILGIALMLTASYVFLVAAILFIIRAVVLMMIMMLSPLAFLAFILPSTESYADQWKESLIKQSLFAPIYLSLCFVVVKTIQSPAFKGVTNISTGSDTLASIFSGSSGGGMSLLFYFIMLIALMLGSILVAKKMEAHGVETAVELGKAANGFVGRQLVRGTYVSATTTVLGGATKGVGRLAERIGFKDFGKYVQSKGANMQKTGDELQKKMDINELDKRFKDSTFGATAVGAFIREKTTQKLVGSKFGSEKSVKEAYEEDEKLKSRRFALEKMESAKESVEQLNYATEKRKLLPNIPDWQDKKYKDAGGNFDQAKFDTDFKKFIDIFKPQESDYQPRQYGTKYYDELGNFNQTLFNKDNATGKVEFNKKYLDKAGVFDKAKFDADGIAGKAEFVEAGKLLDDILKLQPKRSMFATGPAGDAVFAKTQANYVKLFTEEPDKTNPLYTNPAVYARAKKIYDDRKNTTAKADKEVESATAAVGYSMNQVAPEEFANMQEETIKEMAKYANLRQLKAVATSENWTVPEIQEMLGVRWAEGIKDFKDFSQNIMKPYNDALELLDQAVKNKNLDLDDSGKIGLMKDDGKTQQTFTDPATGKRYAICNDGTKLDLPPEPKLPSHLKSWIRNKMTKEEYELASSISPQLFDNPDLVHVIRWGLTNKDFRTDENMPFDLRDRLTYMKDSKLNRVVEGAHDPDYIAEDSAATRAAAVIAATAAAKAAVRWEKRDELGNLILDSAGKTILETLEEAQERAFRRMYAKMTPNDTIRNRITTDWATGRAANEIAGARGRNRNSKAVLRLVDKGLSKYWTEKDTEDIVALLETVLGDYLDEERGRGIVSDKNKELLEYLFTDPRCTLPKANAVGALSADLQTVYRRLETEGRLPAKKISFRSDNWKKGITP